MTLEENIKELGMIALMEFEDDVKERIETLRKTTSQKELEYAVVKSGFWPILKRYL